MSIARISVAGIRFVAAAGIRVRFARIRVLFALARVRVRVLFALALALASVRVGFAIAGIRVLFALALARVRLGFRIRSVVPARVAVGLRRIAYTGNRLAYREGYALLRDHLDQRSVGVGVVGHVRLVGLDLDQRLALLHLAALVDEPFQDRALLHRVRQPGHHHFARHHTSPNVASTASTTSFSCGIAACSSGFE
jgi:hypothetical protein